MTSSPIARSFRRVGVAALAGVTAPGMAAGDMISTTGDLHTFFSALQSGRLLPPSLLAEMRTTHPDTLGFGLGVRVQVLDCGSRTMTASITGDAPIDPEAAFPAALNKLVDTVFCNGQATG